MKKIVLLLIGFSLIACGTSKTVRDSRKIIKGDWILNNITYSQSGTYNVTLLNDVSKDCFEGSSWSFVPNNNTGIYNITNAGCTSGERYFIFDINEINESTGLYNFMLKPTNGKYKSETNQGFRLKLTALSEYNMQWQQTVTVDDMPFTITMNFTKI